MTIDGTSQAGAGSDCTDITAPLIELNGSGLSAIASADGLWITAGNSVVRGLTINRFPDNGIQIDTNGGNRVECSYIGMDANRNAGLRQQARYLYQYGQ